MHASRCLGTTRCLNCSSLCGVAPGRRPPQIGCSPAGSTARASSDDGLDELCVAGGAWQGQRQAQIGNLREKALVTVWNAGRAPAQDASCCEVCLVARELRWHVGLGANGCTICCRDAWWPSAIMCTGGCKNWIMARRALEHLLRSLWIDQKRRWLSCIVWRNLWTNTAFKLCI